MTMTGLEADIATAYRNFADREARGNSPLYEKVCLTIAADAGIVALIGALPAPKRQPNLVLASARFAGAPTDEADAFVTWLREHWPEVEKIARSRSTQTNEVGRCATLRPFLVQVAAGQPIALAEVGCSAGLTLYPDLYRYRFTDGDRACEALNPSDLHEPHADSPLLTCALSPAAFDLVTAAPALPRITWRGGLDLNPLDVLSDTDDALRNAAWLDALVWPDQSDRRHRLTSAIAAAREAVTAGSVSRPAIVRGDVVDDLDLLLDGAPPEAHLVLFHSAVLAYVDAAKRTAFVDRMREMRSRPGGFTWMSNEAPGVVPGLTMPDLPTPGRFVLAVDGVPRALTGPHGQRLDLL